MCFTFKRPTLLYYFTSTCKTWKNYKVLLDINFLKLFQVFLQTEFWSFTRKTKIEKVKFCKTLRNHRILEYTLKTTRPGQESSCFKKGLRAPLATPRQCRGDSLQKNEGVTCNEMITKPMVLRESAGKNSNRENKRQRSTMRRAQLSSCEIFISYACHFLGAHVLRSAGEMTEHLESFSGSKPRSGH